jgi:hypothetical protein
MHHKRKRWIVVLLLLRCNSCSTHSELVWGIDLTLFFSLFSSDFAKPSCGDDSERAYLVCFFFFSAFYLLQRQRTPRRVGERFTPFSRFSSVNTKNEEKRWASSYLPDVFFFLTFSYSASLTRPAPFYVDDFGL